MVIIAHDKIVRGGLEDSEDVVRFSFSELSEVGIRLKERHASVWSWADNGGKEDITVITFWLDLVLPTYSLLLLDPGLADVRLEYREGEEEDKEKEKGKDGVVSSLLGEHGVYLHDILRNALLKHPGLSTHLDKSQIQRQSKNNEEDLLVSEDLAPGHAYMVLPRLLPRLLL